MFAPRVHAGVRRFAAQRVDPRQHLDPDAVDQVGPRCDRLREQQQRDEAAERKDKGQRVFGRAEQERATQTQQGEADDLQHTRHHQLPGRHHRRCSPEPLLAVDERGREHRAAGHGGRQRVARVEGGLRPPLVHLDACRLQQRALDLSEAVHRRHRRGDRGQHPQPLGRVEAVKGLGQLVPHQGDLDRQHHHRDADDRPSQPPVFAAGASLLAAGAIFAGASWDTPYSVKVWLSDRRLHYRHGLRRIYARRCGPAPDSQGGSLVVAAAGDNRPRGRVDLGDPAARGHRGAGRPGFVADRFDDSRRSTFWIAAAPPAAERWPWSC